MRSALVLLLLAAAADAQIKIGVNATTIESAPVFLAERSPGVQIVPVPNGRVAMAQLLSGNVDAATGSETQMLLNSIAEPGIRIVVTLAEARYRIIARRSAGIRRIEDLRGKKVAATVNTSSQYYLREMLRKAGMRLESDVRFVNLEGPDMPAALKRGDVDAVAIWEPHAQNSLEALGSDSVDLQNAAVYRERFNLNTTTKVLQDPAKRRALVEFLRAVSRASDLARRQPVQARTLLAPFINTPEATMEHVWNRFVFPANLPGDLPAVLGDVEIFVAAVQNRQPRPRASLSVFIDPSLLSAAKQ
ncbi:MAG TPA: ABC transporter substrate-binding protein [Bryobacteraceae bacterium]|nr:ABC transporter substrate-binding protein [Bryobacteraceae bacterium]